MLCSAAQEIIQEGFSGLLGTRDEANRPDCTWVFGARVCENGTRLRVFVQPEASEIALENLAANGRMAVTVSRPCTDKSAQVKGQFMGKGPMSKLDLEAQALWFEKFTLEITSVGANPEAISQITVGETIALELRIEEAFSQTPGPRAGEKL